MIELFKMHEGFNTDVIKQGEVFYLHIKERISDRLRADMEFKGNVIIYESSSSGFGFISADSKPGHATLVSYDSVKRKVVDIVEMRQLT